MKRKDGFKTIKRCRSIYLMFSFCLVVFSFNTRVFAQGTVAVVYLQNNNTYAFASAEMKKALETAGYRVELDDIANLANVIAQNRIIITIRGTAEADSFLNQPAILSLPSASSEGYSIRKKINAGNTDWYIIGADKNGALYGAQDLTRSVQLNGFQSVSATDINPYIANRGIKFNIPLDARTPGYSDNGDAAQKNIAEMWNINFWHELLDDMARDRFNMLSIWSLAPFPSLADVPEYPNAGINDVKKTTYPLSGFKTLNGTNMSNANVLANLVTLKTITLSDKIKFWQGVMQYASDRGINCYLFTWNTYTFGTENSGYNFTSNLSDSKTKDYFRKATKALIGTYPLLKGMGITAGENLNGTEQDKESFLYGAYGQGINDALTADPNRTFRLIHRAHEANISVIKTAFAGLNTRCSLEFSFKYSQAHMYSSVAPDYIYKANFLNNIGSSKFFLTLRDDDWYYLRGGSDPAFTRAYLKNIPNTNFNGFYIGPDGYTWGREYISKTPDSPNQLVFDKRWYSFQMWGQLAYNPDLPDSFFTNNLKTRFPEVNTQNLYDAWAKASQIIPWVNRFHNVGCQLDYQWYPEACFSNTGFHDVNKFISAGPQSSEGLMSIPSYADAVLNNTSFTGTTPPQVAQTLQAISDQALSLIADMAGTDKELRQTISDITTMAYLGQYFSKKILGATNKSISDKTSDTNKKQQYQNNAITYLRDASERWRNYASQISYAYNPQWLTRMQQTVDVKAIQSKADNDIVLAGGTINRIAVTGVTVNPTSVNIFVDSTWQLTATVSPVDATNKNIRWTSGNNAIATVNANGLVKAGAAGSVIITATSLDGSKTASCNVTATVNSGKVSVLGSWVTGTAHAKAAGSNRALIVFIYGEHYSTLSVSSARYGGRTMTPVIQKSLGTTTNSYTGAFVLNEAGIATATDGNISVTWANSPSNGSAIISVFFSNADQSTLIGGTASGGSTNATTVSTNALSNTSGDAVFVAATAAYNGSNYMVNNGFIKGPAEQSPSWGDIVAAYKIATGANETPAVTMPTSMRQSIIGFVLKSRIATNSLQLQRVDKVSEPNLITIYPNPVSSKYLTVDFHKYIKNGLVQLFDLSGRLVTRRIIINESVLKMDMNKLSKGTYLLNINIDKTSLFRKKILIE